MIVFPIQGSELLYDDYKDPDKKGADGPCSERNGFLQFPSDPYHLGSSTPDLNDEYDYVSQYHKGSLHNGV